MSERELTKDDKENLDIHLSVQYGITGGIIMLSNGDAVSWNYIPVESEE